MIARALKFSTLAFSAVALLFCDVLPCEAASFSTAVSAAKRAQEEEKLARLFDEFVDLRGECDLGARLDNLAIQLMQEPEATGYIIIYAGKYDLPARTSAYREHVLGYLINSRGVSAERISLIDGGHREKLATELWIAPKGADAPVPSETINTAADLNKAFLFADEYVPVESDTDYVVEDFEPVEEVADESATDEANAEPTAEEQTDETGAGEAEAAEETQEEAAEPEEAKDVWWNSRAYARALGIETKSRGHIIFYADREEANFSKVQARVREAMSELTEKYGIKAERLTATFGGYRQSPMVELWLVPVNVSLPVATPDPEKKEDKSKNPTAEQQQPTAP